MKALIVTLLTCLSIGLWIDVSAQIINVPRRVENKVVNRVNNKIDRGIDKGLDAVEDEVAGKDKKTDSKTETPKTDPNKSGNTEAADKSASAGKGATAQDQPSLQSYSQYDFVPGDKVILYEDFSQDAVGDFPALWTTNKSDPTVPTQPIEETTVNDTQTEDLPAEDEVLIDPERPQIPPRQVGLPYEPGGCGCEQSHKLTANSESLSTMQSGFENLQKCVDNFSNGPVTDYIKTLKEWSTVTEDLGKAINAGPAEFEAAAKVASPIIESLLVRTKSFDEAGKSFLEEFKACPESMKSGVEVLNSVNEITVESLKINY